MRGGLLVLAVLAVLLVGCEDKCEDIFRGRLLWPIPCWKFCAIVGSDCFSTGGPEGCICHAPCEKRCPARED